MELQEALKIVIAYLDGLMEEAPSQQVADAHNFLIDLVKIK